MFTRKELKAFNKVNLTEKFLDSKDGQKATQKGYNEAIKQTLM